MRRRFSSWAIIVFTALVTGFFLARWWWFRTDLFTTVLSPARVAPFVSLAKLAPQALGSYYAGRCAQHYGKDTPIRRAWTLMSGWLGCWFAGQLTLGWYVVLTHQPIPSPSLADALFLLGSVLLFSALVSFVSLYRASGFAVGSRRQHGLVVLLTCAVFSVLGYRILVPIAEDGAPLVERTLNLVYPLQDLLLLAAVAILCRIAFGFRGGKVWRVWGSILTGILCATGGDVVFAYSSVRELTNVGPLADLGFTLGYGLCAYGARLQYELVAD